MLSFFFRNVRYGLSSVVLSGEIRLLQVRYVRVRHCIVDVIVYKHSVGTALVSHIWLRDFVLDSVYCRFNTGDSTKFSPEGSTWRSLLACSKFLLRLLYESIPTLLGIENMKDIYFNLNTLYFFAEDASKCRGSQRIVVYLYLLE